MPFVDRDLAGDDRRSPTVAFFEDFEEVVAGGSIERLKTPIIEDEQLHTAKCPQQACIPAITARKREVGEQLWNALVEDGSNSVPTLPPAPGRFSTTNGCPETSDLMTRRAHQARDPRCPWWAMVGGGSLSLRTALRDAASSVRRSQARLLRFEAWRRKIGSSNMTPRAGP